MGLARGLKKRRKTEKKSELNASSSGSSEKEESTDWWDEFYKRINGRAPLKGLDNFKSMFKISRNTFNYICSLVKDDFMAGQSNFVFSNGTSLTLHDQVAVALRRLSSGNSLVGVGDSFGLHHSTVSQITWRFVESMEERGLHHLQWPSTETEMTWIKTEFEKVQGLPNCCGAIAITHITMNLPASDPTSSIWLDSQKNHSMILQAIVDPTMRFRDTVTGWPGKVDELSVFQNSSFYQLCEAGKRLNGKKMVLGDDDGFEMGEYIVGGSRYPLLPYLITPYSGLGLPEPKAQFNKRHMETADVARGALTRLKETWGIIKEMMWRPDKNRLPRIILVCCILHNIIIDVGDEVDRSSDMSHSHNHHEPSYDRKQQTCGLTEPVSRVGSVRDMLSQHLSKTTLPQ